MAIDLPQKGLLSKFYSTKEEKEMGEQNCSPPKRGGERGMVNIRPQSGAGKPGKTGALRWSRWDLQRGRGLLGVFDKGSATGFGEMAKESRC